MADAAERDTVPWSAAELVEILDHVPAMVSLWDRDARNRFANRAYLDWFGVEPEDLRGSHVSKLLGPTLYPLNRPYIEAALTGRPQEFERSFEVACGEVRTAKAIYTPYFVAGRVAGFFVLAFDVTPRVHAEAVARESVEQIALLHERQSVAVDLHDLVVQRLYAAGLDLNMARRGQIQDSGARIRSAMAGIDDAVLELRRAIRSLNRGMLPTELAAAVDGVVRHASRTLGFAPSLTYLGSLERVPPGACSEILALLNEALANVARHAAASKVEISIDTGADQVEVRIADDGKGMTAAERRSGLRPLRARVGRVGGELRCEPNSPTGTVVVWRVPQNADEWLPARERGRA